MGFAFSDFGNHEAKPSQIFFPVFHLIGKIDNILLVMKTNLITITLLINFSCRKHVLDMHHTGVWRFAHLDYTSSAYSNKKNTFVYTPMLRMFKGDYAAMGLSDTRDFMVNFVKRF